MAKVLVPLAQGCEELEAVTIIDLLRRAELDVTTASLDSKTITASRGTQLIADTTIDVILNDMFDNGLSWCVRGDGKQKYYHHWCCS